MVRGQKSVQDSPRPRLNQITDEGVIFQSHLDGSKHTLSPEIAMKLQYDLGVDLTVAFEDHEYKNDQEHLKKSVEQTQRWALRSIKEYKRSLPIGKKRQGASVIHLRGGQLLYGFCQKFLKKNPDICWGLGR